MKISSLSNKWVLALCGAAAVAIAGTASAAAIVASGPRPGAHAPTPRVHNVPRSQQTHYVAGPFISAATAQGRALAAAAPMGSGARVLQARLMSVSAASAATGQRVASYFTGGTREVWLVWMRGPWKILNCIQAGSCPVKPNQVYFVAIDAKTGVNYGLGWQRVYPHGAPGE